MSVSFSESDPSNVLVALEHVEPQTDTENTTFRPREVAQVASHSLASFSNINLNATPQNHQLKKKNAGKIVGTSMTSSSGIGFSHNHMDDQLLSMFAEVTFLATLLCTKVDDKKFPDNFTISHKDIKRLLYSRFGASISEKTAAEELVVMGGPRKETTMDSVKMLSLILTPELVRAPLRQEDIAAIDDSYAQTIADDQWKIDGAIESAFAYLSNGKEFLTRGLLLEKLIKFNEIEMAANEDLLDEMWKVAIAATGKKHDDDDSGTSQVFLTRGITLEQFKAALQTGCSWNTGQDFSDTSIFEDIYGKDQMQIFGNEDLSSENNDSIDDSLVNTTLENQGHDQEQGNTVRIIPSKKSLWASIDYISDEMKSSSYMLGILTLFILTVILYLVPLLLYISNLNECSASDGACKLGFTVVYYLMVALIVSLTGIIYFVPISVSNAPFATYKSTALSLLVLLIFVLVPFIIAWDYADGDPPPKDDPKRVVYDYFSATEAKVVLIITLLVGIMIFAHIMFQVMNSWKGEKFRVPYWKRVNRSLKTSGAIKARKFIVRAIDKTHELSQFTDYEGDNGIQMPSVINVFKDLLNGSLARREGIVIPVRILMMQVGQWMTILLFIIFGIVITINSVEAARNSTSTIFSQSAPEEWMILASYIPGFISGLVFMIILTVLLIPSYVQRVTEFRTGRRNPLLPNPKKKRLLFKRMESVGYLIGMAMWLLLSSGFVLFLIVTGSLFLLFWEITREVMIIIIGIILGSTCTYILKTIALTLSRAVNQKVFMRIHRFAFSTFDVGLMSWVLATGTSPAIGRLSMLLLAFALFLGRVDSVVLDTRLRGLDFYPNLYETFLLAREVHMHPYILRLSMLFLKKMAQPKSTSSEAADCWRLIFTMSLFPWVNKYRVRNVITPDDTVEDLEATEEKKKLFCFC